MAITLASAPAVENLPALRVVEQATIGTGSAARKLAVCARADGSLHLCREVERAVTETDADGKRTRTGDTEKVWKVTGALADMADAIAADLIAA